MKRLGVVFPAAATCPWLCFLVDLNSLNGARYVSHTEGDGYVMYVFEGLDDIAALRLFELEPET